MEVQTMSRETIRSTRTRLLLVAAVAVLVPTGKAVAERRCELPAEETGRTCPVEVCLALQANVHNPLSCDGARACSNIFGCPSLLFMRQNWRNCQDARNTINITCWGGGDDGHRAAADMAGRHVAWCTERIAKPVTQGGCGDPCENLLQQTTEPVKGVEQASSEEEAQAAPEEEAQADPEEETQVEEE
jgi:Novel toxin 16